MTCKDCIHYEACSSFDDYENDYAMKNACYLFKDKSLIVELPLIQKAHLEDIYETPVWILYYLKDGEIRRIEYSSQEKAEKALKEREKE